MVESFIFKGFFVKLAVEVKILIMRTNCDDICKSVVLSDFLSRLDPFLDLGGSF